MSDASISKEMRPPAIEAVQSTAQCTTYIFLCSVDFVRRLEDSCINNYHKCLALSDPVLLRPAGQEERGRWPESQGPFAFSCAAG